MGCPPDDQPSVPVEVPPPGSGTQTPPGNENPQTQPPPVKEPETVPPASGATLWLAKEGAAQDDLALDLAVDAATGDLFTAAVHGYDDLDARAPTDDAVDLVLTRRSGGGQTLWTRTYDVRVDPTPVELRADVRARVAADGSGGMLLAGNLKGTVDLGTGKLRDGAFVAKVSADGATLWAHRLPGELTVKDVAADAEGRLYVAYTAPGSVDLGNEVKGSSAGVAVFAADGTAERAFAVGSAESEGASAEPLSLAPGADGSVAVAGRYTGTVRFGTNVTQGSSTGSPFVALYRQNGALGWAKVRPGVKGSALDVSRDAAGDVVAGGDYQGSFAWAGTSLKGASSPSPFVVVTGADGTERWARDLGVDASVQGVAIHSTGEVLVVGYTYSWLENGASGTDGLGSAQLFTQRFDPAGQPLASRLFLGTAPEARGELYGVEAVPAVTLMPDGDAVLYGYTDRVTDFGVDKLKPTRGDVFLVRVKY
ncbi:MULTISPECIES: hypothetical protein [unclassified Corallococcus]|uniref:hypothetical protein n=1 Tax=unclassified Corallococcus TaxID=2685029 RepID=UPI001A8CC21A|nr:MULTISPECIES: hypothetical protein [unclassified Corallococcus]MBN9682126.1 hypothetical protein [Corallococcus sp. NCSPR001]WAS86313.1 hypothetical protein O0N60_04910 [Corallococcus sp. NCRR]